MLVNKCSHLRDLGTYVKDKNLSDYDKMGQVREVVNIIRTNFMRAWKLGKFLIVNKMMIQYKGSYCCACYYMPKDLKNGGSRYDALHHTKNQICL